MAGGDSVKNDHLSIVKEIFCLGLTRVQDQSRVRTFLG